MKLRRWMGRNHRTHQGSVTVFLCLLLTGVLGFIGVCLEYGRAQAVSCQLQIAADAATESVFAGFHAPLYSEYGILGRLIPGGDIGILEQESLRYLSAYSGGREDLLEHGSFLSYQREENTWSDLAFLTDQNGRIFTHMAADAMIRSGIPILREEWKHHLGLDRQELDNQYRENAGKTGVNQSDFAAGVGNWADALRSASDAAVEKAKAADEAAAKKAEEERKAAEAAGEAYTPPPQGQAMKELRARRAEGKKWLDMVEDLRGILNRGVLAVVIPKDCSISAGIIPSGNLPSELPVAQKSRCVVGSEVAEGNGLLFREYLLRHMKTFTSHSDQAVAYELEYVICGKRSDADNLKAAVERIVLMRTAMNLAYLAQSAAKQEEAMAAATLAVGWTGVPPLIEVTQKMLLAAWALAEAICDVRTLLAGQKVVLVKNDSNWKLALENLIQAVREEAADAEAVDSSEGMSYEDYLRILLYLQNQTTLAYRGMDVIQWNMARLDPEYRVSYCMVSGKMRAQAQMIPIFSALYGSMGTGKTLTYVKGSSFSYLKP